MQTSPQPSAFRIGPFILDLRAGELRKGGTRIRLQEKSLRVLAALAERQGEVVTREELKKRLWAVDTFVDFETGLNTAVSKLRDALSDNSEKPRYVETIPRRGYRLVIPAEAIGDGNGENGYAAPTVTSPPDVLVPSRPAADLPVSRAGHERVRPPEDASTSPAPGRRTHGVLLVAAAVLLAMLAGLGLWALRGHAVFSFVPRDTVLIADFQNHTGDPRFDDALQTALLISLRQSRQANIFPQARLASVLQRMGKNADEKITPALGREICQRESIRGLVACSITRTGREYALTAELIDPQTGEVVSSHSERSSGEDHILDALDKLAGAIRRDLGESLYQIRAAAPPLPRVTTPSLAALKQYADGQSLWRRAKYDEAMGLYRGAVGADPDFAMAHAALGNGYYSYIYYQPEKGMAEYEKALSLTTRTTERERLSIQANFEVNQNHVDEAVALFKAYLARYPDDWNVQLSYARVLRTHNRGPEAIEQYKQVLRIAPDDARTYVDLATTQKVLGQFQDAVRSYEQAFRLEPGWQTTAQINREYGFTLVALGEDEKAVQVFTTLLDKEGTKADGLRSLALFDLYHGRFASARERLEQELRIQETSPDPFHAARIHYQLAVIAKGQGNLREQVEHLDLSVARLNELGPKVTWAALVGQEYARAGAPQKAKRLAEAVAGSVDPRNAEDGAYLQILKAEVALAEGDAASAIQSLLALESENSASIRTVRIEALAHAYQKSGDIGQAILWFEKLLAIPQGGASAWEPQQHWIAAYVTLASDYAARGERQEAQSTLAIFLDRWKDADANLALLKQAKAASAKLQ